MSSTERGSPVARLPVSLVIALRYLRSTRRDAFTSFLSIVAIGGIALGVAALILALSAVSGLQRALRSEVLGSSPDVVVELDAGRDADGIRTIVEAHPGLRSIQLVLRGRGWLLAHGRVRPVELVGYDGELPPTFTGVSGRDPGLYAGAGMSRSLGLERGASVELASALSRLTPLGPRPRSLRLEFVGTFEDGQIREMDRVAMPLRSARLLLGEGREKLEITTVDLDAADALAGALAEDLPTGVEVRSWRDLNRPLLLALRLERALTFLGVFLIVVVGALALVSAVHLLISSKRAEIGMLGAMGASPRRLRRIFVILGLLVGGLGCLLGATLGLGGAWVLDSTELISLPGDVYFLDHVPFEVNPGDVVRVLGAALLLAFLCSLFSSRQASRLKQVEALRR